MTTGRINQVAHPRRRRLREGPHHQRPGRGASGRASRRPSVVRPRSAWKAESQPRRGHGAGAPSLRIHSIRELWRVLTGRSGREAVKAAARGTARTAFGCPPSAFTEGAAVKHISKMGFRSGRVSYTGNCLGPRDAGGPRGKGMRGQKPGGCLRMAGSPPGHACPKPLTRRHGRIQDGPHLPRPPGPEPT
jgi:hypothetical protein